MSTAERIEEISLDEAEFHVGLPEQQEALHVGLDLDDFAPNSADPVRDYLKNIGKVALLNAEQEVDLAKRIEAGMLAEAVLEVRNPETREAKLETTRFHMERKKKPEAEITKNINWLKAMAMDEMVEDEALNELVKDKDQAQAQLTTANLRLVVSLAKAYKGRGLELPDLINEGNLGLMHAVEKFDYTLGWKFSTYATSWIRQAITRGLADRGRTVRLPVHIYESANRVRRVGQELLQELERQATPEEIAARITEQKRKEDPKAKAVTAEEVANLQKQSRDTLSLDHRVGTDGEATIGDYIIDNDSNQAEMTVVQQDLNMRINGLFTVLDERSAVVIKMRYGIGYDSEHTLQEIADHFGLSRERVRQIERDSMQRLRRNGFTMQLGAFLDDGAGEVAPKKPSERNIVRKKVVRKPRAAQKTAKQ